VQLAARVAILFVLSGTAGSSRAEDLPPELVARPATLPSGMIAATLGGGYDSAHVLGISVLSATSLGLEVRRGMTSRLELALATGLAVHPDAGWSRDGSVALAYRAWTGEELELAPSLAIPLTARDGVDITSTIVLGAGVRWHASHCILVTFGQRLVPLPIRPAVAFDLGADATVVVQLAQRVAVVGEAVLGEVTVVGQTDRGVAPWHHLPSVARLVYASPYALDVALELHGDARDPRNDAGVAVLVTRRM
jgi:hypothetical protein